MKWIWIALIVLAACSGADSTAQPTDAPTQRVTIPRPTATNTIDPASLATPESCQVRVVDSRGANIYAAAGDTVVVGTLQPGTSHRVVASNAFDWYVIAPPDGGRAWVSGADVTLAGPCEDPPRPTPGPTPTSTCASTPRNRLIVHERGRVLNADPRPLNVRADPGTGSSVLDQIPANGIFFVLEGPQCSGDFAWYRVRYQAVEGWIAEGDLTSYYVEPYLPG